MQPNSVFGKEFNKAALTGIMDLLKYFVREKVKEIGSWLPHFLCSYLVYGKKSISFR